MRLNIFLFSALTLFIACKGNPAAGSSEEVQSRYDQVMMIHDEVMPKMRPLRSMQKQITKKMNAESDQYQKNEMILVTGRLQKAEDDMMDWMHNFKLPNDKSNEEQIQYLMEQQKLMEQLRKETEAVLNDATAFTKK